MARRSCILVSLILSSCSLEYRVKKYLLDLKGYEGITSFLDDIHCLRTWSITNSGMTTCLSKDTEEENCTVLSVSYNVSEAKELYVNIKTETRDCTSINFIDKCTDKFNLSVHYQINENDFKRVILPDEIPTKNTNFGERWLFYHANDDVNFSVDQNYKSMKLGF